MTPPSAATPTLPAAAPGLLRPVALEGLAKNPGCAQDAPLFFSMMPSRVAWRPAASPPPADAESDADSQPAMHQALHLCAVDHFDPKRPFSGASRAVWRL